MEVVDIVLPVVQLDCNLIPAREGKTAHLQQCPALHAIDAGFDDVSLDSRRISELLASLSDNRCNAFFTLWLARQTRIAGEIKMKLLKNSPLGIMPVP